MNAIISLLVSLFVAQNYESYNDINNNNDNNNNNNIIINDNNNDNNNNNNNIIIIIIIIILKIPNTSSGCAKKI